MKLLLGDCLDRLKELEDNSVDAVVTDPPYEIGFMGKGWDDSGIANNPELWKEVLRVLKPGGHLLSFSHSRTYHRQAVAVEDAGFEIRDQIMWIYGSGFPKSHDVGKNVEKIKVGGKSNLTQIGTKPGLVATNHNDKAKTTNPSGFSYRTNQKGYSEVATDRTQVNGEIPVYEITNDYKGWGTALKPAHEPIVVARKPFKGNVAQNVLEWGTGGINIDGCRVATDDKLGREFKVGGQTLGAGQYGVNDGRKTKPTNKLEGTYHDNTNGLGRFPANIIFECTCENIIEGDKGEIKHSSGSRDNVNLTHEWGYKDIQRTNYTDTGNIHTDPNCPCYILDQQSGNSKSSPNKWEGDNNAAIYGKYEKGMRQSTFSDTGGASRFFYCPKASKKDRNEGCDKLEEKMSAHSVADKCAKCGKFLGASANVCKCEEPERIGISSKNNHPTVKPTDLMAYLIRLVTPKGGIVLDPFMGSGSTGKAAVREGMEFIGIEREAEYMEIAKHRIGYELDKKQLEESKRKFW